MRTVTCAVCMNADFLNVVISGDVGIFVRLGSSVVSLGDQLMALVIVG